MIRHLKRLFSAGRDTVRECRHCGTTLEREPGGCPTCGSAEVATYVL